MADSLNPNPFDVNDQSKPEQLQLFPPVTSALDLPDYQVRESRRARHVSIKISLQGGVEIVVPPGFDRQQVGDIVRRRRAWIQKALGRLEQQQTHLDPQHFEARPSQLELRSREETWNLSYQAGASHRLILNQPAPYTLALRGTIEDIPTCTNLLRQWLTRKARAEFAPWLRELSFDINLPFNQVSIRGQKTRWASCSSQKNISLNYKLLFLPSHLVQYVFVHELCHTVHMDHSAAFWKLVEQKLPSYRTCRDGLKDGWQYVPRWVEGS